MANEDETHRTNPAEIENLIEQIRRTNLEPGAKEKIERLLRTVLTLVELLQRKNASIKKLRQMIFGKRTEKHQRQAGDEEWRIYYCIDNFDQITSSIKNKLLETEQERIIKGNGFVARI